MRNRLSRSTALTLALVGGAALLATAPAWAADPGLDATTAVQQSFTPVPDFSNLVKHVAPAVVSVDVHEKNGTTDDGDDSDNSGGQQPPNGLPPGFPQIPGMPFGFGIPMPTQPQVVEAKGSGFIIDSSGLIITNNHVVKNAQSVTVTLSNGETYKAKVLGTDPKTDLAVLKIIPKHPLPYVELGSSATVAPGQWVVAIGNPFALDGTVTAGIVSALGRNIDDGPYDRFIQIDAPINQGNSGGPLFNQQGQVIGVNTAILSPSGGSVGIGFAIPADMVKRVTGQLIHDGKVVRGYLGVKAQEISPQMASALNLPTDDPTADGALVAAVAGNSPAAKAGLQPGDVITSVNGQTVTNPDDLATDIANVGPGQTANLTYLRNGQTNTVSATVVTLPTNPDSGFGAGGSNQPNPATSAAPLGLKLTALSADLRAQLNVPDGVTGAVIAGVKPNSPADLAGLQPGDVIAEVGTTIITSPDDAAKAITAARSAGSGAVALRVLRNGEALFVGIDLGTGDGSSP